MNQPTTTTITIGFNSTLSDAPVPWKSWRKQKKNVLKKLSQQKIESFIFILRTGGRGEGDFELHKQKKSFWEMGHNYPYKLWHTIQRIYTDNICCSPGKRRQQYTKSGQLAAFFNQGQFSPKRCYSNFNSETLVYSKIYQVLYRKYIKKPLTKTTREEGS